MSGEGEGEWEGERYGLRIRGRGAVDLVTAENHQIRLLLVKHLRHEVKRPRVSLARAFSVGIRYGIPAHAQPSAEVQVGNLHNLEPARVRDPGPRPLHLAMRPSPHGKVDAERWCVQQQRCASDGPAVTRLGGVIAKEHVHFRHGLVRVTRLLLVRAFDPHARRPLLPLARPRARLDIHPL